MAVAHRHPKADNFSVSFRSGGQKFYKTSAPRTAGTNRLRGREGQALLDLEGACPAVKRSGRRQLPQHRPATATAAKEHR